MRAWFSELLWALKALAWTFLLAILGRASVAGLILRGKGAIFPAGPALLRTLDYERSFCIP